MFFRNRFRKKIDREKRRKKEEMSRDAGGLSLHSDLKVNLDQIKQEVGNSPDVIIGCRSCSE